MPQSVVHNLSRQHCDNVILAKQWDFVAASGAGMDFMRDNHNAWWTNGYHDEIEKGDVAKPEVSKDLNDPQ